MTTQSGVPPHSRHQLSAKAVTATDYVKFENGAALTLRLVGKANHTSEMRSAWNVALLHLRGIQKHLTRGDDKDVSLVRAPFSLARLSGRCVLGEREYDRRTK